MTFKPSATTMLAACMQLHSCRSDTVYCRRDSDAPQECDTCQSHVEDSLYSIRSRQAALHSNCLPCLGLYSWLSGYTYLAGGCVQRLSLSITTKQSHPAHGATMVRCLSMCFHNFDALPPVKQPLFRLQSIQRHCDLSKQVDSAQGTDTIT